MKKTPTVQTILRANIIALVLLTCATLYIAWAAYAWPDQWPIVFRTPEEIGKLVAVSNPDVMRSMLQTCLESANVQAGVQRTLLGLGLNFALLVCFFATGTFVLNVLMIRQLLKAQANNAL